MLKLKEAWVDDAHNGRISRLDKRDYFGRNPLSVYITNPVINADDLFDALNKLDVNELHDALAARDHAGRNAFNRLLSSGGDKTVAKALSVLNVVDRINPKLAAVFLEPAPYSKTIPHRVDRTFSAIQMQKISDVQSKELMLRIVQSIEPEHLSLADHNGNTAMSVMAEKGFTEALELALFKGAGADPSPTSMTTQQPLKVALDADLRQNDKLKVLNVLLSDQSISVEVRGNNPTANALCFAISAGDNHLFDKLIEQGHAVNAHPGSPNIPLIEALKNFDKNEMFYRHTINTLLDHGANTQVFDSDWQTPAGIIKERNIKLSRLNDLNDSGISDPAEKDVNKGLEL